MNKLERQNQIIQSIQNSDKMTASQLAKLFKVSKRTILRDIDDLEDVTTIDSWDKVSYINHPVEIHREEGMLKTSREKIVSCYDKNCHD